MLFRSRTVRGPLVDHAAHQRHHDVGDLGFERRRQHRGRLRLAGQRADGDRLARRFVASLEAQLTDLMSEWSPRRQQTTVEVLNEIAESLVDDA